jgi:prolyl oligopeptidase
VNGEAGGYRRPVSYPDAPRLDLVEQLHGHPIADPYRYLEDPGDPRTVAWSGEQDVLTRERLDAFPGRAAVGAELTRLFAAGAVSVPMWRAGREFFTRRMPGAEHAVLHVREADGTEHTLLDVTALDPSGLTTLDSWAPSVEGDRLAYQLSVGGDEESLLHVLDVLTGERIDGPIDRCRYSPVAWVPGGTELYYVRRLAPGDVPPGEEQFHRRVWLHRVGADPGDDVLVHGEGLDPTNYYGVRCSTDGRWLVVDASAGTAPRDSVWIADRHGCGQLVEVLTEADAARCSAWVGRDGRLFLNTTLDAPRGRLCVADPTRPRPKHWTELVAEDPDSVLGGVRWLEDPAGGEPLLVVARTRHALAELHLHAAADGTHRGTVPLPGAGSLTGLSTADELTAGQQGRVWIGWTDFVTPPCVHGHRLGGDTTLVQPAPGAVDLPAVHTRQVCYRSTDGTMIRMFVVAPAAPGSAAKPDRPCPTLLTGYGGFALSRAPGYTASALAWVAAGGVWALASLRGGAEEGEDWHRAGMREHKHRVFEDFHSAAEALYREGWTTPGQLAVTGGSNGGLLVGVALTQRPELYRAVVCSAPLLDMVRYELFSLGRTWSDEYGTAADPTELEWLLGYSPYHAVRCGIAYPAVLFTVFDADTRVDPLHARKMCAALQHATAAAPDISPVLIRREIDAGHAARSVSRTVALAVDQLTFLARHTGLDLTDLGRP